MKDSYYFQHDYNARNDDKILELRGEYGNEGYAVFFYCLETMAERGDGYIIGGLIGGLSLGYGVTKAWLLGFLDKCVEIGAFEKDEKGYFSPRMIQHIKLRNSFKLSGKKGADKRWGNRGAIRGANAKERKGKERKIKDSITSEQSSQELDNINKVFNVFYETINPTINYGNKTSRLAAEWMIKKWGVEKVIEVAEYACSVHGEKFAPTITTPYMLKEKLSQLKAYKDKQSNSRLSIGSIS